MVGVRDYTGVSLEMSSVKLQTNTVHHSDQLVRKISFLLNLLLTLVTEQPCTYYLENSSSSPVNQGK